MLDNCTPLKNVDCGQLCESACCKGDGETGMYLFPHEEIMFKDNPSWLEISESRIEMSNGKKVLLAVCNGTCPRERRPLSCRVFPLVPSDKNVSEIDLRARAICPLCYGEDLINKKFYKKASRCFRILSSKPEIKPFLDMLVEINTEFKRFLQKPI